MTSFEHASPEAILQALEDEGGAVHPGLFVLTEAAKRQFSAMGVRRYA